MASRLSTLLIKLGRASEEQIRLAEESALQTGNSLIQSLHKCNVISEDNVVSTLSEYYNLERIRDLENLEIEDEILRYVPHTLAIQYSILPLRFDDNSLVVALSDPTNIVALNEIRFLTGHSVKVLLARETPLKTLIEKYYEDAVSYDSIIEDLTDDDVEIIHIEEELNIRELAKSSEEAPIIKLVNAILTDAVKKRASDIHIEPYEYIFRVRFRIDGILYEIMKLPIKLKNAITSRVKIMADLDIAERRLPQDGRIKILLGNKREMEFRVSVLPNLHGEKVVLRLLDKKSLQTDMTQLGFSAKQLSYFQEMIRKPYGLILVTGPTGSGKTTTLYSAITELNKSSVNISTAEDPVEYNLPGVNQVQVNDDIGLNFAAALRSFLRQDPDIILVGEIRDYETAEIAIKASLTGHLVFSTLHTNDAASTITRMLNMGVEPFLVSSSIHIVIAQRLARVICTNCKEEIAVPSQALIDIGIPRDKATSMKVFHGIGCSKCNGTGYSGRTALYEVLQVTESIRELVLNGSSPIQVKREAINNGMATLRLSGLRALHAGITTIEEILRVTTID